MCDSTAPNTSTNPGISAGVRVVTLHLPEDEGEGLGFKLTRTLWDPYPWVREVSSGGRADAAGLRSGDCVLQADGRDLLGLPVGQVAGMIRGDGGGHGVSLLVWSCGNSPQDDPELLWSAGGGVRGERSRRALSGVLRALACAVCSATAAHKAAQCSRGHLYCAGCRARLQRCALCRETLPPIDSPQAKNLIAEQVFDAIASVYELKEALRPPNSNSASSTPQRSPLPNIKAPQISVSQTNSPNSLRKTVQFGLTAQPYHGSDNSLNRPKTHEWFLNRTAPQSSSLLTLPQNASKSVESGSQTDLNDNKTSGARNHLNPAAENSCKNVPRVCSQSKSCCCQRASKQPQNVININTCCQNTAQYQNAAQINQCQNAAQTNECQNAAQSNQCQNSVQSRCQTSPENNPQYAADINCRNTVNASPCCQSQYTQPCHAQYLEPRIYCSQPGLNMVPVAVGPGGLHGLQHRLVARLRPASSLVDLRNTGVNAALSKSLNNINAGTDCVPPPGERSGSMDNLPKSDNAASSFAESVYLMAPPSPMFVWACEYEAPCFLNKMEKQPL